jgi:hypothetical protein
MGLYQGGGGLGVFGLTPAPTKTLFANNYLSFNSVSGGGTFAKQFLPEIYEQEVERYGNRSVASFVRMIGAEIPMASDQVIWSEQGRLHIAYSSAQFATANGTEKTLNITGHAIRAKQTVVISNGLVTAKGFVSGVATNSITVQPYATADWPAVFLTGTPALKIFVYGSEFEKKSLGMVGSVDAGFESFSNSPIILKDKYSISGSDVAQIGWVEVTTENGASGYLWYLKSEHETRLRFEDYLEMSMVEGEIAAPASGALANGAKGTEGLFKAVENRGNIYQNFGSGESTLSNAGPDKTSLQDFDTILKNLDKQGAIEENMLFLNRNTSLAFDDMLAAVNAHYKGGSSYGVFDNDHDMALNLGFSGFRRGSYDFYKTDWKYLNDASTRGMTEDIAGILTPAGTTTVYDQVLGKNIKRPFLHVRYRSSEADDRRMKSWITGSVGGATNSEEDAMNVNFLSERCVCVHGANNFVLFKSVAQTA